MAIRLPKYIDDSIQKRLHKVIDAVSENLPEKPAEAFVSTSQSEPKYLGVWLFTKDLAVEIRMPLIEGRIQYDICRFRKSIDWIRISARNYDFIEHREDSELELEFSTADGVSSALSADGAGCPCLMELYKNRFLPNFIGPRQK